ncbi:hypothetical protein GCM10008012_46820 [Rhizobium anhuiense]|nr:hypothetical protein GCM10008012_46820 [Rhizobium anhuiense]
MATTSSSALRFSEEAGDSCHDFLMSFTHQPVDRQGPGHLPLIGSLLDALSEPLDTGGSHLLFQFKLTFKEGVFKDGIIDGHSEVLVSAWAKGSLPVSSKGPVFGALLK